MENVKKRISFESDYTTGAHPKVLEALAATNLDAQPGYGSDIYCESARERIRAACGCPEAEVEFLTGGTQTNAVVISTMLSDSEGVIAADTGHIEAHEAGAIEYTGHKVLPIAHRDGKLPPEALREYLARFYADANHEHCVYPGMVYISYPTEYGTLYSRAELSELSDICHSYDMPLYLDGARLGYGLMSGASDLTLPDIARLCDVFYIGGTKVGAFCGEAVVFPRGNKPDRFLTSVKKRGALLAKGRLLGVQFDALFTYELYFEISRHAIKMAERLRELFIKRGLKLFIDSPTNQQFVILEDGELARISESVAVSFWEKYDDTHTVVRFATSWSTTEEDIAEMERVLG